MRNSMRLFACVAILATLFVGFANYKSYAQADEGCIPGYDATSYEWDEVAGDSPCSVEDAKSTLQSSTDSDKDLLTAVNGTPGNPTPVGWALGTSDSEADGVNVIARHVPEGTCVDFDPGATKLYGEYDYVDFTPLWRRAHMKSDGALSGLKATFYWTPCTMPGNREVMTQPEGMDSIPEELMSDDPATPGASDGTTTASPENAAKLFSVAPLNDPANWMMVPGSTTQVMFTAPTGTAAPAFTVPEGAFSVDYDDAVNGNPSGPANAASGKQVPAGATVFTLNWL